MIRLAVAQIRHRRGRTAAMLAGVLAATTGFTLLTATAQTSRLETVGTVDRSYRAAYDILVRPQAARSTMEETKGLVRPNFLSGQFGGITRAQSDVVARVPGVEVAAPVAMVGYVMAGASASIDVTEMIDASAPSQLLKVKPTWHSDRGLTTLDDDAPRFAYVTTNQVLWPRAAGPTGDGGDYVFSSGATAEDGLVDATAAMRSCASEFAPPVELLPDGGTIPICDPTVVRPGSTGLDPVERISLAAAQRMPDGGFVVGLAVSGQPVRQQRLTIRVGWPMPLLLAAVDPDREAQLVGLDRAVVSGRYLISGELRHEVANPGGRPTLAVPVLASTRPYLDEQLAVAVSRAVGPGSAVAGLGGDALRHRLGQVVGDPVGSARITADEAYARRTADGLRAELYRVVRPGLPRYDTLADGTLRPERVDVDVAATWQSSLYVGLSVPWFARDMSFRAVARLPEYPLGSDGPPVAAAVGLFDPALLTDFSPLSMVPLETYRPAAATGADPASRELLAGEALEPNGNPGGYLATPPQILTTLDALPFVLGAQRAGAPAGGPQAASLAAPISAVRVRVAGVTGMDELSQERVRRVAEEISQRTGLDVDVTVGSSPAPQPVRLDGGRYGRPDLLLSEGWTKKGVAVAIIQAVDRKSLLLFGLVLVVCVLFLTNAVGAAVRDRRRELAVLRCLGWTRRRIAALILAEVGIVGLVAGVVGAVGSLPVASALDLRLSIAQAMLAIPVALVLAAAAGLTPALRASTSHPASALQPTVLSGGRRARRRGVLGLAVANVSRVPGRSALGVVALAVGVAAATFIGAVLWVFDNSVTGTLLGDAVSVQARGVDIAAALATVLLGALAVADVIYLGIRERGAEFATLRATGWSAGELARLIAYEGTVIGLLGALLGAGSGMVMAAVFTGTVPAGLGILTTVSAAIGAALGCGAALIASTALRYLPTSILLAEE